MFTDRMKHRRVNGAKILAVSYLMEKLYEECQAESQRTRLLLIQTEQNLEASLGVQDINMY